MFSTLKFSDFNIISLYYKIKKQLNWGDQWEKKEQLKPVIIKLNDPLITKRNLKKTSKTE
jgi:hypothetical protein